MIGEIIGHAVAVFLVVGPVLWAIRRADKLSAERTTALGFKLDNFIASLQEARSEKAMRASQVGALVARVQGAAPKAPPAPYSGVRLAQPDIDDDQRETYYGGKP